MAENTEEKRADTVAVSRSTVKAITWVASSALMAISWFVWDSGTKVDNVMSALAVLELRVQHLEGFANSGPRFTSRDGDEIKEEIREVKGNCAKHKDLSAHREQAQLNREIFWRIEKLEVRDTDPSHGSNGE